MISYGNDMYNKPENYGLEIVGEVTWDDDSYQFDFSVVWEDSEGLYYTARDSGCSCPSPFEDFDSLAMLEGPFTAHEVIKHLQDSVDEFIPDYRSHHSWDQAQRDITVLAERLFS